MIDQTPKLETTLKFHMSLRALWRQPDVLSLKYDLKTMPRSGNIPPGSGASSNHSPEDTCQSVARGSIQPEPTASSNVTGRKVVTQ